MSKYYVKIVNGAEEYAKEVAAIQEEHCNISMIQFLQPDTWIITYIEAQDRVVPPKMQKSPFDKSN